MFTSRTAESYDPLPHAVPVGDWFERCARSVVGSIPASPRPEFEPTRDEEPWEVWDGKEIFRRCSTEWKNGYTHNGTAYTIFTFVWAPRDRKRNRILIQLRDPDNFNGDESFITRVDQTMQSCVEEPEAARWYTPDEMEHARRVFTKLYALDKEGQSYD